MQSSRFFVDTKKVESVLFYSGLGPLPSRPRRLIHKQTNACIVRSRQNYELWGHAVLLKIQSTPEVGSKKSIWVMFFLFNLWALCVNR